MFYTFDSKGKVLDTKKYYWALAEMIAAAGLLGQRTGEAIYWEWYDKAWELALKDFIEDCPNRGQGSLFKSSDFRKY